MERLTNSRKNCYQDCPRKFWIEFEKHYRPVVTPHPLRFGSLIHKALEFLYKGESLEFINKSIASLESDPYDVVSAQELINGYAATYSVDTGKVCAVEAQYEADLLNPETQGKSKTFILAGKIDAVITEGSTFLNVEHKTTSDDVAPESRYWLKLNMDPQNIGYVLGAKSLGYDVTKTIYDVIAKPLIKPGRATPEDRRKYKKDGTLYANMREDDEPPEEYRERLRQHIAENDHRYYARKTVSYMEEDIIEYLYDMWAVGRQIADSRRHDRWPRRPAACHTYGECPYFPVCSKMDSLHSDRYVKIEEENPELSK